MLPRNVDLRLAGYAYDVMIIYQPLRHPGEPVGAKMETKRESRMPERIFGPVVFF
jgi:hypothetical protein